MTPPAEDALRVRARHSAEPVPALEPADRHLRVVDEKAARRERQLRVGIWVFGLVSVVSVFVVVAFHVMVAQSQLQLDRLNRQVTAQQQQYERLELQAAQLSSPDRIATRAEQLGMQPGGPSTFITVPESGASRPAQGPTSSTADYQKVKQHLGTRP
ncbi:MAG: cell division protein FtsL [Actinobacteria bacterium]|nr:cell division protein FtsL [Actinomycetota bacterium]